MTDLLLFTVYVLAYGAMGSVLGLSGALWFRRREQRLMKTIMFLIYLTVLFLFSGLRFFIEKYARQTGPSLIFVLETLKLLAYAGIIYFLPATINYILGRRWTSGRLIRNILAAFVYLVSGMVGLVSGASMIPGMLAVLAFLLIVLFVLVDASRSLPMVKDESTRTSLFFLYGLTFLYLPLDQILPLVTDGLERSLFLAGSLYFLAVGATANVIFLRAVTDRNGDAWGSDGEGFLASGREAGLSPRECEIAVLIARGLSYKEIAADLSISPNTVSNHVATIYRKTGTRSKVEMVNILRNR